MLRVNAVVGVLLDQLLELELVVLIELVIRIVAQSERYCSPVVQSHCSATMRSWSALFR